MRKALFRYIASMASRCRASLNVFCGSVCLIYSPLFMPFLGVVLILNMMACLSGLLYNNSITGGVGYNVLSLITYCKRSAHDTDAHVLYNQLIISNQTALACSTDQQAYVYK